jgi:UDP-GlcNAc:undecaprenyl-phosphate/decaprenyl-phosphate GlcNAc-1-phosphate transferase
MIHFAIDIPIPSPHLISVFLGSLLLCVGLTWLTLRYQSGMGMDEPDEHRKQHGRATSRLGGLPIFVTLSMGMVYAVVSLGHKIDQLLPILLCNALMFSVGFLDDLRPLGAKVKLVGQIGVACVMFNLGNSVDMLSNPFGTGQISLGWLSLIVTVLWLVAVPNIINLIDGMDGLATGFGLFLCLTLAVVGHFTLRPDVVMMSAIMTGALAGFLFFNFPPAKIFLGDGGAYMIGFFIASVSLYSSHKGTVVGSLLVVIVALGVPILDTLFAIIRRGVRGVPVFRADAEHIHHRLLALGFSKEQSLGVMYSASAVLSLVGLTILAGKGKGIAIAAATVTLLALGAARYLGYVRYPLGLRQQFKEALTARTEVEFAKAYGRVLELEADRMASPEEFVQLLNHVLTRLGMAGEATPETINNRITISLTSGLRWSVYGLRKDWSNDPIRRCVESLAPGVEAALERWGQFPGSHVHQTTPVPSKPTPSHEQP